MIERSEPICPDKVRKLAQEGYPRKAVRQMLNAGSEGRFRRFLKRTGLDAEFLPRKDWKREYRGSLSKWQRYSDKELIGFVQQSTNSSDLYNRFGVGLTCCYLRWPHLKRWADIKAWCDSLEPMAA